ncbi:hypothetical protein ACJJTC_010530 [Scirpophaga incertulas]
MYLSKQLAHPPRMALGAFGAITGGSHANRMGQNDYSPPMARQVEMGPVIADSETSRKVEDKEATYRRRVGQMDKTAPTAPAMVQEKRSRGTLFQAASTLAKKMAGRKDKGRSLIGFFAGGLRNTVFATAVARALLTQVTKGGLAHETGDAKIATGIMGTISLWASREETLLRTGGDGKDEEIASPRQVRERLSKYTGLSVAEVIQREEELVDINDTTEIAVCALMFNRPLAARALDSRVCIVCLAKLSSEGELPDHSPNNGRDGASNFDSIRRSLLGADSTPTRVLQAAAEAHNREMHALNGNIYFCCKEEETRLQTVERLRDAADRGDRVRRSAGTQAMTDVWSASANTLSALIARRATNVGRQTTSALGTQHCFSGFYDILQESDSASTAGENRTFTVGRVEVEQDKGGDPTPVKTRSATRRAGKEQQDVAPAPSSATTSTEAISFDVSTVCVQERIRSRVKLGRSQDTRAQSIRELEDIMSVVEDVVRETTSVGDTETGGHRDGLPQLVGWTEGKYWFGVGMERKFNVASLTPTAEAATLLAKEQDPGARDGRLNARFPQRIWSYIQDCGVLQIAAVDGATASRCDIRPLALKTKLLDNVRSYGYLFPTGVTWSVPLRTNVPFENSARDIVDNWNYQVISVTPQVLDVYVREGAVCSLPVGGLRWGLTDPDVALVALDYTQGLTPVLWALQIVNALPYPLLARTEWFALNDSISPDDIKVASFLRNESQHFPISSFIDKPDNFTMSKTNT